MIHALATREILKRLWRKGRLVWQLATVRVKRLVRKSDWSRPYDTLRDKWVIIPTNLFGRMNTRKMLKLSDEKLMDAWRSYTKLDESGDGYEARGWYRAQYKDQFNGKRILDVGCGFGADGVAFAQSGAKVTFLDIVESNLHLVRRICDLFKLKDVNFSYMEGLNSLQVLGEFDVIWCAGSMHHAPFEIIQREASELLRHLRIGGGWIQLAYPKERWERDGSLSFDRWAEKTDGPGTPWAEWYDLDKLQSLLKPARFRVNKYFNFHSDDFNWFDLVRIE